MSENGSSQRFELSQTMEVILKGITTIPVEKFPISIK